jgi:HTH-type transcriptional regulator / antitoxin HigA
MATAINQYRPDYAVPPGWVLEERLEVQGISHAEFARRCGRSAKLISEIIAGKAPLEPETALQFEKVLGVDASIWLGIEANYRLHRARQAEAEEAGRSIEWMKSFPVRELVKGGAFANPASEVDAVSKLLRFFGVGSLDAWRMKYGSANVAYRHLPSFKSNEAALAAWLRLGELEAERQECADYDEAHFKQALKEIRGLTRAPIEEALPRAKQLCNRSGVALALVKPLPSTALSGAAWWLSPRKAVIVLSARHKTDDHLWFCLFHEAAHILLHSKKTVFIDGANNKIDQLEEEANEWASNMLVPRHQWERFVATRPRSRQAVCAFADEQGIAPGIVVGKLQHGCHLPWKDLNGLKKRFVQRRTTGA